MSIQFLTSLLQYDELSSFKEGLCAVCKNDLWGFIDNTGKEVIATQYEIVDDFRDGLAKVELNGQTGVIDTTGKFYQLPDKFKDAKFHSGLAFVKINDDENGYGFIDKTGELAISELYKNHSSKNFVGHYAIVRRKEKHLFFDTHRYKIIDISGRTINNSNLLNDLMRAGGGSIFGKIFISRTPYVTLGTHGVHILNLRNNSHFFVKCDNVGEILDDEVLPIRNNGCDWGFVDINNGNTIIPCEYDDFCSFSDGLAFVQKGNWKGFIDKSGKVIINNYTYSSYNAHFKNGFLSFTTNRSKFGLMDKTGREIIPPEYTCQIIINENVGKIAKYDQSGFVYLYPTNNGAVPIFCFEPFYGNDITEIIIDRTKVKINRNGQLLNDNNGYIHPEILADFNSRSPSYHQNNDNYKNDNFKSNDSKVENFQQKLNIPLSDIPLWIEIFPKLEQYPVDELEKFLLQQTEIHCEHCEYLKKLPESIGLLQNLQKLSLFDCENISILPESIGQLQSLKELDIWDCKNIKTLPESIGQLQQLKVLGLRNCQNLFHLPKSIVQLQSLKELVLLDCENIRTLPENIGQLQQLQKLELKRCKNLATLSESIGQLQDLQELDLYSCESLTTLPESIEQLQSLKQLTICSCEKIRTLPKNIGQLQQLEWLCLLICPNITTLPQSIRKLNNLQHLSLESCINLATIPESIGELNNLQLLSLECCENLTTLPESIGQLQNLQRLRLRYCGNLTTLPESIGLLQNLQELDLRGCKNLTLPKSIINLSKHCEILTDD
ncbi:MAG: WG repeat-containing protein [Neisseriaceae bacterium]|nr:WG repeat-containing protein [Neisseriaceae bacterium]